MAQQHRGAHRRNERSRIAYSWCKSPDEGLDAIGARPATECGLEAMLEAATVGGMLEDLSCRNAAAAASAAESLLSQLSSAVVNSWCRASIAINARRRACRRR